MDLDRGVLARIDRRVLSSLDSEERYQMVRVPATSAMWSTWRRYCSALGVSMGRGVTELITHELFNVIAQDAVDLSIFSSELERKLAARTEDLDAQERRLDGQKRVLIPSEQRLRTMERHIRVERSPLTSTSKVGRNERCPCQSGLKYKHCHGLAGRLHRSG